MQFCTSSLQSPRPKFPRFAGSNPAQNDGFLRVVKIRSMTSFGREVKPAALRRKILRHVKDPSEHDRDISPIKLTDISRQLSSCFVTRCLLIFSRELWWMNQEILQLRWRTNKNGSSTWDALYDTTS
jgi:hypothetical protein